MSVPEPARFAVQTRSWAPAIQKATTTSAAVVQAAAFKLHAPQSSIPKKKEPTLSDAQSKYTNNDKQFIGLMRPRGDALRHAAGPTLLEYATKECPVDCGPDWSRERIEKAVTEGPCVSACQPEAAKACRK